jgi:glycosidase
MKKIILCLLLFNGFAVEAQLDRVEPPNWWVGFKNSRLQLMVKGKDIADMAPEIVYPGVTVSGVHKGSSPNYLFIDLNIRPETEPGTFDIVLNSGKRKKIKQPYTLKKRLKSGEQFYGFDSSDVIYLITPDRFANGNPDNDVVKGLKEAKTDRADDYARHGGDIKGITDHLPYISEMGFTAIWPCPLLTNDMYKSSYHGYAITDLYDIDPRFGTLEEYTELSSKANEVGVKLIMDQVANHCGIEHWWMKDLPFEDWVNDQASYEAGRKPMYSNHRRTTNQDIYAAKIDAIGMSNGWFVDSMPDLNQNNPFMATYLIQNSIWWIETAHLSGIRQDTYPYPDKIFMSDWAGAIMKEYPNFSIVGEEWSYNPLLVGYWQKGGANHDGYESNLRSSMDFPMQRALVEALKEEEKWDKGLIKIYEGLANDFYYPSPKDIMIFPDNHDMDRIHTQLGEDASLTKMAMAYLLMMPRIPQIYYGTEILMQNSDKPGDHGLIRTDFPGGWSGDAVNAFTGEGLTEAQKDMQDYLKTLLGFRKNNKIIHEGQTVHFSPKEGVYVLFRMKNDDVVVLILNKNDQEFKLDLSRFKEIGIDERQMRNVITGERVIWENSIMLKGKKATVLTTLE